jgi:peroxiredoxin
LPKEITLMSSSNPTEKSACAKPSKHTSNILHQGKVVLFAVPGAFTPTCHIKHLPEFVENFDKFKEKGVDLVACMATNDHFVLDAWAKSLNVPANNVLMLSDGNGAWCNATGLCQDLSKNGMGDKRFKRFALIANNGIVEYIGVGDLDVSGAEAVLAKL